jgi:cytochrome c oxidase cbb3-type subunit III
VIEVSATNSGRCLATLWRCVVVPSLFIASGCDWPIRAEPPPRPVPVEDVVDFADLYAMRCAGCHGTDGKLGPAPPLNDPIFLAIVPDDELRRVVADGRPGTLMPAWLRDKGGPLTAEQVEVLATGIKKQKEWSPANAGPDIPPYLSEDAGDKEAGIRMFATACARCHGEQGQGRRTNGKGPGAVNDPAFLALLSNQALRRLIITGRPDLGMPALGMSAFNQAGDSRPDDLKPLTSKDVSDIVALLAYWRVGGSTNSR